MWLVPLRASLWVASFLSLFLSLSYLFSRAPFLPFFLLHNLHRLVARAPFGQGQLYSLLLSVILRLLLQAHLCQRGYSGLPWLLPLSSVLLCNTFSVRTSILPTSLQGLQPSACGPFFIVLLWDLRQNINWWLLFMFSTTKEEGKLCGQYLYPTNTILYAGTTWHFFYFYYQKRWR